MAGLFEGGNEPAGSLKAISVQNSRLRWAVHVARMGESRNAYRVLVGRPEGKRPLGKPRRRWEDNIKMDLREVGYDGRDWINLAQDRDQWRAYVRAAMNSGFLKSQQNQGCTELVSIVRSRNKFAFSSDERAFNIEPYFRTVLAEDEMILRDMLKELNDSCEQYGMKINANKTKTMVIGRKIKKVNV
ncbi:hypothetical protein ANN_03706 [Periplaneta americana]|uniref:Uncharacterized protein n=1 Tax=Periplaneta americana TaxID=6978 RepID=A0ABQ8TZN7_PERAM|nr:hypothetical protein ANN_03706 [Periplaneta americana]